MLALAGTAVAQQQQQSQQQPQAQNQEQRASSLPDSVQRLAGEWEGGVQVRDEKGRVSGSNASFSARFDPRSGLTGVFEGAAGGRPVDGAVYLWFDPREREVNLRSVHSRSGVLLDGENETSADRASLVFHSRAQDDDAGDFEQRLTWDGPDRFTLEWFSVGEKGRKTLLFALDMERMEPGRVSAASSRFSGSAYVAQVVAPEAWPDRSAGADAER
jgi:hypothetical protein